MRKPPHVRRLYHRLRQEEWKAIENGERSALVERVARAISLEAMRIVRERKFPLPRPYSEMLAVAALREMG